MGGGVKRTRRAPGGEPSRWQPPAAPSFSLIAEPWIPVVLLDGSRRDVGLREALSRSREIDRISAGSALEDTAILRLIVALLHHAHQGPRDRSEWRVLWDAQSLLDCVAERYLDSHADAFFLLHPERPFGQTTAGRLESSGKTADEKSLAELQHHRASGTGKRLFDKSLDVRPRPVMPAEVARIVVSYQCWAPGGGQGYGSSRLVGRALVCFPLGADLHETVLLNTVAYDPTANEPVRTIDGDRPSWVRERRHDVVSDDRPVEGLVDLLTRRPRAVTLLIDEGGCLGRVRIAAGERISGTSDVRDPGLVYRLVKDDRVDTLKLPRGGPVWRELPALLDARKGDGYHCTVLRWLDWVEDSSSAYRLRIVALDSDQASTVLISDSEVRVPARLADDQARCRTLGLLVESASAVHRALDVYVRDLGKRGPVSSRTADTHAHHAARVMARERAGAAYWDGASRAFAHAMAVLARPAVSGADLGGMVKIWGLDLRGAVEAAVTAVEPVVGAGAAALVDAGAARARLDRSVSRALAFEAEEIGGKEAEWAT